MKNTNQQSSPSTDTAKVATDLTDRELATIAAGKKPGVGTPSFSMPTGICVHGSGDAH